MLYLKRNIRWILPLVILALAIAAFAVAPAIGAHAAAASPDTGWGY